MNEEKVSAVESSPISLGATALIRSVAILLILVGATFSGITLAAEDGPSRFGFTYLWGFSFIWAIVLGSLFFVALQHVTKSV